MTLFKDNELFINVTPRERFLSMYKIPRYPSLSRVKKPEKHKKEEKFVDHASYKKLSNLLKKYLAYKIVAFSLLDADKYFEERHGRYYMKHAITEKHVLNSPLFQEKSKPIGIEDMIFDMKLDVLLSLKLLYQVDNICSGDKKKLIKFFELIMDDDMSLKRRISLYGYILDTYACNKKRIMNLLTTEKEVLCSGVCRGDYGMTLNELLKVSLVLSTDNYNLANKALIKPSTVVNEKDVHTAIKALGFVVVHEWKKEGRTPFIDAFLKSNPLQYYRFIDVNDNIYLNYGCKTILAADYILNDDIIHKEVNKILMK